MQFIYFDIVELLNWINYKISLWSFLLQFYWNDRIKISATYIIRAFIFLSIFSLNIDLIKLYTWRTHLLIYYYSPKKIYFLTIFFKTSVIMIIIEIKFVILYFDYIFCLYTFMWYFFYIAITFLTNYVINFVKSLEDYCVISKMSL